MSKYFYEQFEKSEKTEKPESPKPAFRYYDSKKRAIQISIAVILLAGFIYFIYLILGMPDLTDLENVNPAQASRIYSTDGKVIHELFTYSRIWNTYDQIPEHVIQAALATEDRDFYDHWGINLKRVPGAALANLSNFGFREGFSTITMQVARNLYVKKIGFERSITRKLREILTAIQIERTYSKKEILEMYLNISWFGLGAYGIQSAARRYFNKDARDLTPEEGSLLIGLLKGPAIYSPSKHPERAVLRRNVVLNNMVVCDYLTRAKYDSLKQLPVVTDEWMNRSATSPYFTEYVRLQLNALQDSLAINVYEDGLNIYTTLHTGYQAAVDSAIRKHMAPLQELMTQNLQRWKKKHNIPDSVFAEKSEVQIGFVAIDHHNGHILAMVGGRDFDKSKWNRAVQMERQPGSTFKPFVYASAIDNGYTPIDKLLNQPVVITNPDGTRWTPENFDRTFGGLTTLREGLRHSLNLISARLILEIGPQVVVDYANQMGITSRLNPFPSLAMGSSDVLLIDMVSAFGVFANQGVRVEPVSVLRIEDRYGNVLYEHQPRRTEVLNRSTAYVLTNMLEDAITYGTGGSARWKHKFFAPAAGKTGTTNDYGDAWFVGFTPRLTAGVWVGFDDHSIKLGRTGTGSETALPFWAEFMNVAYEKMQIPEEPFRQPPEIITLNICLDSGKIATNFCPNVDKKEVFKLKDHPTETCDLHPGVSRDGEKYRVVY
jgi:penicillin-binding protein 1A